jgi:hypothetical protein
MYNEMEGVWKKAVVQKCNNMKSPSSRTTTPWYYPGIFLEGLKETTKNPVKLPVLRADIWTWYLPNIAVFVMSGVSEEHLMGPSMCVSRFLEPTVDRRLTGKTLFVAYQHN